MAQYLLDTDICIELFKHNECVLEKIDLIPILPSLRLYGTNKAELEKKGEMIGEFDLLIGSCAEYNQLVMVTSNVKHFAHIPNLRIEDWARKSKHSR